jgi:arylsulfatase A-like enzyme
MRKWLIGTAVVVAVLAIGGFIAFQNYWYYLPGIMASLRDPVLPNHEVVWQKGPDAPATATADRPPNIILILADDLGYNDITFNGGGVANGALPTPHIDSIGRDGANLSAGYSGNATCAPSRAAIMTGRYATRFGFEFTPAPVQFSRLIGHGSSTLHPPIYRAELESQIPDFTQMSVPTSEVTLPQVLKTRGYHNIAFGKWHLGETKETRRLDVPAGRPRRQRRVASKLRSDRQVFVGEPALRGRQQQRPAPLRAIAIHDRLSGR